MYTAAEQFQQDCMNYSENVGESAHELIHESVVGMGDEYSEVTWRLDPYGCVEREFYMDSQGVSYTQTFDLQGVEVFS